MQQLIPSREFAFFLVVTILCIVVIFPFWFPFICGITLAYLIEGFLDQALHKLNWHKAYQKWLAAIFIMCVVVVILLGPILYLTVTSTKELISLLSTLQNQDNDKTFIFNVVKKVSLFLNTVGIPYTTDDIFASGTQIADEQLSNIFEQIAGAITATPQFIIKMLVFVLTSCFFLVEGKSYRNRFLKKIFPWEHERRIIGQTLHSSLRAFVFVNIVMAILQSTLITITLIFTGASRYVLIGFMAFMLSFIPLIGTAPILIFFICRYIFKDRPGAALTITICMIVIIISDNILRPWLMKGNVGLNFFWILLAIFGGLASFGVSGIILGPVAFALFIASLRALEAKKEHA